MESDVDIELLATQYWQEGNYTAQVQLVVDALREAGLPVVMEEEPNCYAIYVGLCGAEEAAPYKWVVYSYKESRLKGPSYHLYLVGEGDQRSPELCEGGYKIPVGPMNQISSIISVCGGDACSANSNQ